MLEDVAKAIKTALEADLEDALDVVEAQWTAAGDSLTLPDPEAYLLGYQPTVVEKAQSEFPIVVITAMEERPGPASDQWGYGEGQVTATVYWFVAADSEGDCNRMAWRYGEAIDTVLRDHERLDEGITVEAYVPTTRVSFVAREMPDLGASDEVFYTQMGEKTWLINVRHG